MTLLASIWIALAVGFLLVSIAGTLVDRHIRARKTLEFKRYIRGRNWE